MKKYVLDACAVIALFKAEEGASVVDNLLKEANEGRHILLMHRINLLEVFYGYLWSDGLQVANERISAIEGSCINVIDAVTSEMMHRAGELKVAHRASLADVVGLSCAIIEKAIFVTADHHELDSIDKSGDAQIFWFR